MRAEKLSPATAKAVAGALKFLCSGRFPHLYPGAVLREPIGPVSAQDRINRILEAGEREWNFEGKPRVGTYAFHAWAQHERSPGPGVLLDVMEWVPFPARHITRARKIANKRDELQKDSLNTGHLCPFVVVLGRLPGHKRGEGSTAEMIKLLAAQNLDVLYLNGEWATKGEHYDHVDVIQLSDGLKLGYRVLRSDRRRRLHLLSYKEQILLLLCLLIHWAIEESGSTKFKRADASNLVGRAFGASSQSRTVMGRIEDWGYIEGDRTGATLVSEEHVAGMFFENPTEARSSIVRRMAKGALVRGKRLVREESPLAPISDESALSRAIEALKKEMLKLKIGSITIRSI